MSESLELIAARFRDLPTKVDYASLRVVDERNVRSAVRDDVAEPTRTRVERGAMVHVQDADGIGYAATSDLSTDGLRAALDRAAEWARLSKGRSVFSASGAPPLATPTGSYLTRTEKPMRLTKADRIELARAECDGAKVDGRIVDRAASITTVTTEQVFVTQGGGTALTTQEFVIPSVTVTAHESGVTQSRSFGGRYNGFCQQGGLEVLERSGFFGSGRRTADDALALLASPNCPSGELSLLLMPDQMMLQIHESIGHPLEIDRILGDERNYAGRSFVTLDMFGAYVYGSKLLNVTYDPTDPLEFASFGADDEGTRAEKVFIIKDGLLLRGLGGTTSSSRIAGALAPVATTRACAWNRPPIDRMSNLNVEAGSASLDAMIASVELGVMMKTNVSWSIDDSRNKFQFGCEWGRMIRNGKLAEVVRNPNYRGVSATFWRALSQVGDASTREVMGTPYCGKGEPNQVIRVGHASPACLFDRVAVFGGEG